MIRYISIVAILLFNSATFAQTLDEYFGIAAENNPGLHSAYKEYEAALQRVPQVSALSDPILSFGFFISQLETRVGPQQARFSLTQLFPWFGTLKAQGNLATLIAEAKFQNFIDKRNKLYLQVASAYYPLFELKDWVRIEQKNIDILQSYKVIVNQRFKSGNGSMVDVLRVDILLKEALTNLDILKEKEKPLLTRFNKLLNRPENDSVVLNDKLRAEIISEVNKVGLLIAGNPKLKALDLKYQASQISELVALKQGMPKFGVGLDYVLVGERTDISMPDNGKNVLMPMVSVSIPFFRAKYNASVKEARLLQESYTLQKQETMNTLISEYEMAWFQVQEQSKLISLYEQQIMTSEQSLELLFASYGNSGTEFEEVLRMQQQLLQYQKMKTTALVKQILAIENINYIMSNTNYNEITR